MMCEFESLTKGTPCSHGCGRVLALDIADDPHAECRPKPGLGDRVASLLARCGLTKTRYRRWKVRWGLADACGCAERQEAINRFGRAVRRWRKGVGNRLTRPAGESPPSRPASE